MDMNKNRPIRLQWMEQPLPLARLGAIGLILLIAYASLSPFDFSFETSVYPWDWILAPLPKYITLFDVLSNVLGYIPFGFLMVFALFPQARRWKALVWSVLAGMLLSGGMESLQTYVPSRVSSNVDLWANSLGTLIGGLFALPFKPIWFTGSVIEHYRFSWFGKKSSFLLMYLMFPWAQIYPQNTWLGMGDVGVEFPRFSLYWRLPLTNATQEILISMLAVISVGAYFLCGLKKKRTTLKLLLSLLILTMALKSTVSALQYGIEDAFSWLNLTALLGMGLGLLILLRVELWSDRAQWRLGVFGLVVLILSANLMPLNPYHLAELDLLPKGRFIHFHSLLQWLNYLWPFLAIYSLLKFRYSSYEKTKSPSSP